MTHGAHIGDSGTPEKPATIAMIISTNDYLYF